MTATGNTGGNRSEARSRCSGFTLLEVIFAGMVITVAMLGLSGTMAQGHVATTGVRDDLTARRAIRSKMAEIRDTPFDSVKEQFQDKEFNVEKLHERARRGFIKVADGPSPGLFKITITMRWSVSGDERSLSQSYLLTKIRGVGVLD